MQLKETAVGESKIPCSGSRKEVVEACRPFQSQLKFEMGGGSGNKNSCS